MNTSTLKWISVILLMIFSCSEFFAQLQISNTLMASGSHNAMRPKISVSNSIGETFIFSSSNDAVYVNQGLHNIDRNKLVAVNDHPSRNAQVYIYPNPAVHEINLKADVIFNRCQIYTIDGFLIKEMGIPVDQRIEILQLQEGLYIIKLISKDNIIYSGKFIKK